MRLEEYAGPDLGRFGESQKEFGAFLKVRRGLKVGRS